ncbi:MAG TPA: 3-oxoacyl-[acyl-carrier-protein] reductase [Desulfitobacteriaceae bacterium]|nr:3-oxoacyl-[acyl-carrier-protein] reductase [Desulfitobacteriaceae bacterium]
MMLDGRVAVVTGAARGIGKAIVLELAAAGATVVINDIGNLDKAEETVQEITAAGGRAMVVQADISQASEVDRLVSTVIQEYGKIDILVNNAGIARDNLLMRMKEADWDTVMNINLKSVFLCTKAVSKGMLKQRSGAIVNIASVVGIMGNAGQANYAAAKAGIIGFTKSMAKELASRGVRVNAVAPGYIATDMTAKLPEEVKKEFIKGIPLGRIGSAEDVAKAVLFLVSPAASYMTGQTLSVDGGMAM